MNNPNSPMNRAKRGLRDRWSCEDYPGAEPRFQLSLFIKDVAIFVLFPVVVLIVAESFRSGSATSKRPQTQVRRDQMRGDSNRSQIIEFEHRSLGAGKSGSSSFGVQKKAPGVLIRIKLMNVVETYSSSPVHAQVMDRGLGANLLGGVFIGDATPDPAFERINITFRFVRDPNRGDVAIPVSARALSLDGTFGLTASKKEGLFARSAFSSAASAQDTRGGSTTDLKEILIRALTIGLTQEAGNVAQTERNRSQVLTLQPGTEFFAELTDYFPSGAKL